MQLPNNSIDVTEDNLLIDKKVHKQTKRKVTSDF
jgi:hypothetical protein